MFLWNHIIKAFLSVFRACRLQRCKSFNQRILRFLSTEKNGLFIATENA